MNNSIVVLTIVMFAVTIMAATATDVMCMIITGHTVIAVTIVSTEL